MEDIGRTLVSFVQHTGRPLMMGGAVMDALRKRDPDVAALWEAEGLIAEYPVMIEAIDLANTQVVFGQIVARNLFDDLREIPKVIAELPPEPRHPAHNAPNRRRFKRSQRKR